MRVRAMGQEIIKEFKVNRPLDYAPKLAYFFFLSLFPLLICMVLILGLFLDTRAEANDVLHNYLSSIAPASASNLVNGVLKDITEGSSPLGLSFAVILTFWTSSRGILALIEGLNKAYKLDEVRSWWKRNLVSLGLTLAIVLLFSSLIILIVSTSPMAINFLAKSGVDSKNIQKLLELLKWPVLLFISSVTLGLIYKVGPAKPQKRILPGIVTTLILWVLSSLLFRGYLVYFGRFNATYGSLSAVMILMIWLYLSGLSVLIGATLQKVWIKKVPKLSTAFLLLPFLVIFSSCSHDERGHCWNDYHWRRIDPRPCDSDPDPIM